MISASEIASKRTSAGGWTKQQLAEWGVPWPPPSGWKKQLQLQHDMQDYMDVAEFFETVDDHTVYAIKDMPMTRIRAARRALVSGGFLISEGKHWRSTEGSEAIPL